MMMKIVLWASIGWMPILICVMFINETKFKKNIVIGVTLPHEAREDQEVQEILKRFKKQSILAASVLMLACIPCMFISGESAVLTVWLIWLDAAIVIPVIPYIFTNMKLHEVKNKRGWKQVSQQRTAVVNMDAVQTNNWISPWVFLPSAGLCLVLILFDPSMAFMYVLFAVLCVSFWLGYRYLYRNKAEMVDENTELTVALSRIRKYNWGKMWIICSYSMTVYAACMCFFSKMPVISMILMVVVTAVLCFAAFKIEFRTRALQEKLTKDSGQEWYSDEDDHWIWGMFYYNPDDSRLIINNRIGVNSTVNIARTTGKILMIATGLLLALMPFTGVWVESIGSQPITMTETAETFTVKSGSTTYTIKNSEIKEATLLEELPSHLSRKMGTGMEHYLEGSFTADEIGNVTVLLDPTVSPYLLIQTEGGKYYLFGTRDEEMTKDAYTQLKAAACVPYKEVLTQMQYAADLS